MPGPLVARRSAAATTDALRLPSAFGTALSCCAGTDALRLKFSGVKRSKIGSDLAESREDMFLIKESSPGSWYRNL